MDKLLMVLKCRQLWSHLNVAVPCAPKCIWTKCRVGWIRWAEL